MFFHAVVYVDIRLQDICLRKVSNWLRSQNDIKKLPLPFNIQNRLRQYIHVITPSPSLPLSTSPFPSPSPLSHFEKLN